MDTFNDNLSYDYNNTLTDMFDPSSWERGFLTSANVGIFLCICGSFLNFTQIVLLLGSPVLRSDFLYIQVLNVTIADLGFVITVDSFTVYFELQSWSLGTDFCKAWMLLDIALPYVSLVAILFLNADRIFFTYETKLYTMIMSRPLLRMTVILFPWCVSAIVVCTLWLGFSEVEPYPGVCMYGISKEANTASTWLTVFMPAIFIIILLVFVFIAAIGEIPSQSTPQGQNGLNSNTTGARTNGQSFIPGRVERAGDRISVAHATTWTGSSSLTRHHRRFITALLAVDFISLALALPFPAFSHVSPNCNDLQSCQSLRSLFQTLSWMRSSVVCIRPLFFMILTDIRQSCAVRPMRRLSNNQNTPSPSLTRDSRGNWERISTYRAETMRLTSVVEGPKPCHSTRHDEYTTSTVALTPPTSPKIWREENEDLESERFNIIVSFV